MTNAFGITIAIGCSLLLMSACSDSAEDDSGGSVGGTSSTQAGGATSGGSPTGGSAQAGGGSSAGGGAAGSSSSAGTSTGGAANAGAGGSSETDPCGSLIIDNITSIAGHVPTVLGQPEISETAAGTAVCFDGVDDALVLPTNPIEGLSAFTLQLHFRPDSAGSAEQRVVHLQEDGTMNRALFETRSTPQSEFYLDTFLLHGAEQLTLVDENQLHSEGEFYWVALSYDGATMRHFVRGVEEASGELAFTALGPGQTSIGSRLNQVSWFKGCVRELRCSPEALAASSLEQ